MALVQEFVNTEGVVFALSWTPLQTMLLFQSLQRANPLEGKGHCSGTPVVDKGNPELGF